MSVLIKLVGLHKMVHLPPKVPSSLDWAEP